MIMAQLATRMNYVTESSASQSLPVSGDRFPPGPGGRAGTGGGLDPLVELLARAVERLDATKSSRLKMDEAS
jgi:hypothetical protein